MPWSPSSTEKFLSCPMKWWLDRQGAVGRPRDESAMVQGTEFHAAMARWWIYLNAPGFDEVGPFSENPVVDKAARLTVRQEGEALLEQGIVGVEVNLNGDDVEAARHGRYPGTCDLITGNGAGLTVTDYKTKNKMEAKYADGELRQTQRSWQLRQYAHFVQVKYNRPVTHVRKLLVAFTPALKVWLVSYPITQQELSKWHMQAEQVWALMDEADATHYNDKTLAMKVWQNAGECERYGWNWRCDHYETCWDGAPIEYKGVS